MLQKPVVENGDYVSRMTSVYGSHPPHEEKTVLSETSGEFCVFITGRTAAAYQVQNGVTGLERHFSPEKKAHLLHTHPDREEIERIIQRNEDQIGALHAVFRFQTPADLEFCLQQAHLSLLMAFTHELTAFKGCGIHEVIREFCQPVRRACCESEIDSWLSFGQGTHPFPKTGYAAGYQLPMGRYVFMAARPTNYWSPDPQKAVRFKETAKGIQTWLHYSATARPGVDIFRVSEAGAELLIRSSEEGLPPCEGCGACCRCGYLVALEWGEQQGIDPKLIGQSSAAPGRHVLRRNANKSCLALDNNNRCSIYGQRPKACRDYERGTLRCRAAAGLFPSEARNLWLGDLRKPYRRP